MKAEDLRNPTMSLHVPIAASKLELWASQRNRTNLFNRGCIVWNLNSVLETVQISTIVSLVKSQKSGITAGAQSQGTKLPCGARIGIIGNMSYFLSLMILPLLSFFSLPRKKYNWDQCHSENKLNSIRGGLTSVNLHGPGKIQVFVRWAKVNANNLLIFKVQGWGLWVKIILCNQNPINPLESIAIKKMTIPYFISTANVFL